MNESVVERSENAGDAEDEFTWLGQLYTYDDSEWLTISDLRAERDVFLRWAHGFLWRHDGSVGFDVAMSGLVYQENCRYSK